MSEIDRFDALKNFLTDNSYESSEGIFYIFPGKLLLAMSEINSMRAVEDESKQVSQIERVNSSLMTMTKSKNESSFSVMPNDVRLSQKKVEFAENPLFYRMNVSRIFRKEKEFTQKIGLSQENSKKRESGKPELKR